jgi:hypothetical protein
LLLAAATAVLLAALVALAVTASAPQAASKKRGCGSKPTKKSQQRRDTDHDGIPNWRDRDVDGDHIPNGRDRDVDGDHIPNKRDRDVDGDGVRNSRDDDVDGDCKLNTRETDVDGDGKPDPYDTDPYSSGKPLGATARAAAAPAKIPKSFFGLVSNEALAAIGPAQDQEIAAVAATGAGTLRAKLDWASTETSPGVYDFRLWDRFVLAAARANIQVLPVLYNTPSFYPASGGAAGPPQDMSTLARFADAAVRHFGPGGSLWAANPGVPTVPIHSWQVWNEPNYKAFWPTGPNAAGYAGMLKTVAPAIKAADPGAEVVAAGLPESYSNEPAAQYLQELYAAGAKNYFDTVAVHAYARSADQSYEVIKGIRKVMNANGDSKAPIWVTEFGTASGGPTSNYTVDEATQARLVQRTLRGLAQNRNALGLKGLVYYGWQDAPPYNGGKDFWGLHTGLHRIDGSAKPVLSAFDATIQSLE